MCYLQRHRLLLEERLDVITDAVFSETDRKISDLRPDLQETVRICHKWCQDLLPHVISKHHRYHYGLLSEVDGHDSDLFFMAVPFVGKDIPSPESEFSNLDVTFGFTALAYMKQQLRETDIKQLVLHMQHRLREMKYRMQVLQMWQQWTEYDLNHSNLELLDIEMKDALSNFLNVLQRPDVKRYYLQNIVLPKIAVYSPKSLSFQAPRICATCSLG